MKDIKHLALFIECSTGNTPTVETIKKHIRYMEAFGYDILYLGLTDAYKIPGEPYFNYCRGGYTREQLQELDYYAEAHGIELRANIQVLGHMSYMEKYECYQDILDTNEVLMVGEEKTYQFIDKILASISGSIRSRNLHIGMDETWNLGLGKYLKKHGYHTTRELIAYHLERVVELTKKYNFTCEMWPDMFFRIVQSSGDAANDEIAESIKKSVPEGMGLMHCDYSDPHYDSFVKTLKMLAALTDRPAFAGSAWTFYGLAPYNRLSIKTMYKQIQACREADVDTYVVTLWSDQGGHCSFFSVLPSIFAVSEFVKGKTIEQVDKTQFKQIVGIDYDSFMLLDYLNDPYMKDIETYNCRCRWGILMDLFIPSVDSIISEGSGNAYAKLAEKYAAIDGGEFQGIFTNHLNMARVLSMKMNMSQRIRKAYENKDVEALRNFSLVEIPKMIDLMETYMIDFENNWLQENSAYGLEFHDFLDGGVITRWKYAIRRLKQHIEHGTPIEELENPVLPYWWSNWSSEDTCMDRYYKNMITYRWM